MLISSCFAKQNFILEYHGKDYKILTLKMILMLPLEVFPQVLQLTPLYRMSIATYSKVEVLSQSFVLIAFFFVSLLTYVVFRVHGRLSSGSELPSYTPVSIFNWLNLKTALTIKSVKQYDQRPFFSNWFWGVCFVLFCFYGRGRLYTKNSSWLSLS